MIFTYVFIHDVIISGSLSALTQKNTGGRRLETLAHHACHLARSEPCQAINAYNLFDPQVGSLAMTITKIVGQSNVNRAYLINMGVLGQKLRH